MGVFEGNLQVDNFYPLSVAPVDASRDFIYFLRTSSVGGGGGGMLPDFFFCSLFPVQQTTSGIGHRVK